jgi:hypothetical protein
MIAATFAIIFGESPAMISLHLDAARTFLTQFHRRLA